MINLNKLKKATAIYIVGTAFAVSAAAATFTVNSTADTGDSNPGDGICATAAGVCTLRAAIEEANAFQGSDVIAFNISETGVHTIFPNSPLPDITEPLTIDGYTQPGSAPNINPVTLGSNAVLLIELNGTNAGAGADGIRVLSGGSTIRGLIVNRFSDDGIAVNDGDGNIITGNFIGTDATGMVNLGNGGDGFVTDSTIITILSIANQIGGPQPQDRNVIAGNGGSGINLFFSSDNIVQGNIVGLAADGVSPLGNSSHGIFSNFSSNNTIGGPAEGERNIVSANGSNGIALQSGGGTHTVQGNYVGTDVTGVLRRGNGGVGISFNLRTGDIIGGTMSGEGNIVSANGTQGLLIGNSTGILVSGNLIGTAADGTTNLGNGGHGIYFLASASNCVIGGIADGTSNTVAYNSGTGIFQLSGTGNRIQGNSIHSNGSLGVDLGGNGVTPNDEGDLDTGPNNLQNFPVITSAQSLISQVTGTLNSTPNTTFVIDIYSNVSADPSGHGEGETYLGFTTVTTDSAGNGSFFVSFTDNVPLGHFITATATDPDGNTSEFSAARQVLAPTGGSSSVGGRVITSDGRRVPRVYVMMTDQNGLTRTARTNSFGYYRFDEVAAGAVYVFSIADKLYHAAPQAVEIFDDRDDIDIEVFDES